MTYEIIVTLNTMPEANARKILEDIGNLEGICEIVLKEYDIIKTE